MAGPSDTTTIADLDKVVASDIHVKFADKKWKLPGDAPSELLLRITLLTEELEQAIEARNAEDMLALREEISENVEELFRLRNPSLPEGTIRMSDGQVGELVAKLFAHYYGAAIEDAASEEDNEGGDRPTEDQEPETTPSSASEKPSPRRPRAPRKRRGAAASRSSASSAT